MPNTGFHSYTIGEHAPWIDTARGMLDKGGMKFYSLVLPVRIGRPSPVDMIMKRSWSFYVWNLDAFVAEIIFVAGETKLLSSLGRARHDEMKTGDENIMVLESSLKGCFADEKI